jgi:uncharacterized alpha-E superfamily protein
VQTNNMDVAYWRYLLLSISGYELYLKTYRSGFETRNVIEQVVLTHTFPRSIIYSVSQMQRYFESLRREGNANSFLAVEFMIGRLLSKVRYSTAETILQQNLHQYLVDIKKDLHAIAIALNQHYFAYT